MTWALTEKIKDMAAVLGTFINGSMGGDSHRTEERERNQWDVSAPVIQEVSLLVSELHELIVSVSAV